MRVLVGCAPVLLLVLAGCGSKNAPISAAAWAPYASPDGKFSVEMPGTPKTSEAGGYQRVEVSVGDPPIGFSVHYADLPELPQTPKQYFEEYRTDTLARQGGKLVSTKDVDVGGNPCVEFVVEFPATNGSLFRRLYLVKNRIYVQSVSGTALSPTSPDVQKFFDSFKAK